MRTRVLLLPARGFDVKHKLTDWIGTLVVVSESCDISTTSPASKQ